MTPMPAGPRIAYVLDPRFPGGTSSGVAEELKVTARFGQVAVHAIGSRMFGGREVAPQLAGVLEDLGVTPVWDAPVIGADIVILHNPVFLKFDAALQSRIVTRHLIVVAQENFLRPGGAEGFDVAHCMGLIDRASLALRKSVAPVSGHNRATVAAWHQRFGLPPGWGVLPEDWFHICDFAFLPPTAAPRDQRGRLSRPGLEKFPPRAVMDLCFPPHAEANVILGADPLLTEDTVRPHWTLHPFRSLEVDAFFRLIDFMVYFTAPTWQESFGRVLAEGIAAGKVVIADPATAESFDGAVVSARPEEVDAIIRSFLAAPERYRDHVLNAQSAITRFSSEAFAARFGGILEGTLKVAA